MNPNEEPLTTEYLAIYERVLTKLVALGVDADFAASCAHFVAGRVVLG